MSPVSWDTTYHGTGRFLLPAPGCRSTGDVPGILGYYVPWDWPFSLTSAWVRAGVLGMSPVSWISIIS